MEKQARKKMPIWYAIGSIVLWISIVVLAATGVLTRLTSLPAVPAGCGGLVLAMMLDTAVQRIAGWRMYVAYTCDCERCHECDR